MELARETEAKVRPVAATLTVKSLVDNPDLKSTPVTVNVGLFAPLETVEDVAIVFGAVTKTLTLLLAADGAIANAEVFAWTLIVPAVAVPVKPSVSSVELTRLTDAKVSPVAPTPTVKSLVAMSGLKSTPVIVIVGSAEPAPRIDVVAIVLAGAGTLIDNVLLAFAGATVNAEVLA